jgi:predicted Zn-dependent protease
MAALAALAVVILGVAALALGHGSSKPSARISAQTSPSHKSTKAAKAAKSTKSHHRAAATSASSSSTTTDAAAPASTSTSESSSAATGSAASLQLQGHQELAAGSYPQAISTLHRALSAADPSSLTYAYALYDLGRALTLDGNPQAAIPVLEQRLKIPDQTATVQQALDQARAAAGQSSPGSSAPAASSSAPAASSSGAGTDGAAAPPGKAKAKAKPKAGAGPGDKGTGSGGAGLPPGQAKHGN